MKKVIIFNAGSFIYGSERGLLNLIKALKPNFDITVVIPEKGPLFDRIKRDYPLLKVIIFPLPVLAFSFSPFYVIKFIFLSFISLFYFIFYINYKDIDIISTNSLLLLFPALCARLLNKPHIWHIREVFPYKSVNSLLSGYIRIMSPYVICQSKFIREKLRLKYAEVVYEPLDTSDTRIYGREEARRMLGLPLSAVIVSIVSRIHPSKGQYEFIKEVREGFKRNGNRILLIAGSAVPPVLKNVLYKRKIENFICGSKLENIKLLGFREDVDKIFSASDICVFPFLREEPFGIAVAEALARGIDTFYPWTGGLKEVHNIFKKGNNFKIEEAAKVIINYKRRAEKITSFDIPDELSIHYHQSALAKIYNRAYL